MSAVSDLDSARRGMDVLDAFVAGFLSVLVFHQGMLTLLHYLSVTPAMPFSTRQTAPFGVPQIWSQSFWGGISGIVFLVFKLRFPDHAGYWFTAFLFGAIVLTLVAGFIVAPLKGQSLGNGFPRAALIVAPLVNGSWGVGAALFLRWHGGRHRAGRETSAHGRLQGHGAR